MKPLRKYLLSIVLVLGFFACLTQNTFAQNTAVVSDQLQSVYIDGEEIHYIEEGSGDPLIFIHGTIGDYRVWNSRMEPYSNDYHVIAYSRRYAYPNEQVFDQSKDYSVRIHAADLYALIKELDLEKVNIVGHSYGAFTALLMTLEHPEVVNSLVLGEPPAASLAQNTEEGRESRTIFLENYLRPAKKDFMVQNNEEGLEHFLQGVIGNDFRISQVPPGVKQAWMDNLLELWGIAMNEVFIPLEEDAIQSLEVPVLLLVGDISPTFITEITNELHRLLPQSELVRFENMNHGLYFEQPEAVDRAVMNFLEQN